MLDDDESRLVEAPWTPEQVSAIQRWQASTWTHPLTCGVDSTHPPLVANIDGLTCPEETCGFEQHWVPRVCVDSELL